jgi:hypothetical protein
MATDDSQQTTEQIEAIIERAEYEQQEADKYEASVPTNEDALHAYHRGKVVGLRTALELLGVTDE